MKKISLILALAAILFGIRLNAQSSFSVYGLGSFAMGNFGDSNIEHNPEAKGAGFGFGGAIEYSSIANYSGLGYFIELAYIQHSIAPSAKEAFQNFYAGTSSKVEEFSTYKNIPISAGLKFEKEFNDELSLYTMAGLSYNILMMSDFVYSTNNLATLQTSTSSFDSSYAISVKFAIGMIISEHLNFKLAYRPLGDHKVKTTTNYNDGTSIVTTTAEQTININILSLSMGYSF